MAIIEHNGLLLLDGKFWTVQRADLGQAGQSWLKIDSPAGRVKRRLG